MTLFCLFFTWLWEFFLSKTLYLSAWDCVSGPYCWNFPKARDFVYFIDPLLCIVALRAPFRGTDSWLQGKILVCVQVWTCSVQEICFSTLIGWSFAKVWSLSGLPKSYQKLFPRCFSFFQKFLHFTDMLLWFRLIIPSFPAQIDDMRSRFSALSVGRFACLSDPGSYISGDCSPW